MNPPELTPEDEKAMITIDALVRIRVFIDGLPFTEEDKLSVIRGAFFGRLIASKTHGMKDLDQVGNTFIDDLVRAEGKELKESIARYRAAIQGAFKPTGATIQ